MRVSASASAQGGSVRRPPSARAHGGSERRAAVGGRVGARGCAEWICEVGGPRWPADVDVAGVRDAGPVRDSLGEGKGIGWGCKGGGGGGGRRGGSEGKGGRVGRGGWGWVRWGRGSLGR